MQIHISYNGACVISSNIDLMCSDSLKDYPSV